MSSLGQNYGLVRKDTGHAVLQEIPIPKLLDDYLLIKVVAVAVNPTDWTTLDAVGDNGTLVGCDWSGIVEQIGPAVTKKFQKGDRVAGSAHGANDANPEHGAFAKYIITKGDLVLHIPQGVSWDAAATIGVAISTVGLALYKFLGLPLPGDDANTGGAGDPDSPILIYGGSTATGTVAIQFAKLSGRKVITTCSPKHFDLVRDRGADSVYDYRQPDVGKQIRADTQGRLTRVFDTVAMDSTASICADALGPASGGIYVDLLGVDFPRSDTESVFFLGYGISGESYIFEGERYPASPDYFEFGKKFIPIAEKLWARGKWKSHPERVELDGLVGVLDGMKQMKEGKVSGVKLVYRVDETKWP